MFCQLVFMVHVYIQGVQDANRSEEMEIIHPLSPVARIKFLHRGCSHSNIAASAVFVHQHMDRLKTSLSVYCGRKASMALRIERSEVSGYVSVGCFAFERGTETGLGAVAP
jgi:hypothetical protein